MVDAVALLAIGLLLAGVIGTLIPLVPGGLLSLSGVYLHWWASGFAEPGVVGLAVLTVLGVTTLVVEFLAGALSARAGGASWRTTAAAVVVGVALAVVAGPVGLLVGLFATVFILEYGDRDGTLAGSVRAATYATVGVLVSTALQVTLTTAMLVGFLLAVYVF